MINTKKIVDIEDPYLDLPLKYFVFFLL